MRSKDAVLVVKCKTEGCDTDLSLGGPTLPPSSQTQPNIEPCILFDRLELTCPTCGNLHSYERNDVFEKAVEKS
jgi:hypothetical protein